MWIGGRKRLLPRLQHRGGSGRRWCGSTGASTANGGRGEPFRHAGGTKPDVAAIVERQHENPSMYNEKPALRAGREKVAMTMVSLAHAHQVRGVVPSATTLPRWACWMASATLAI